MKKTERIAIEKWLNYMDYYAMKDIVALYEEYYEQPSGSCRLKINQTKTILNFIEYQKIQLGEQE